MEHASRSAEQAGNGKGKRLIRILACIGVSAVLWLFTTLSGQFESEVIVSLDYDLPADQTTTRKLPAEARLLVQTTGWQLIREGFNARSLHIDMSGADAREAFITNNRKELFIADLPSDIQVLHISPDTILLHLEPRITKMVPVYLTAVNPELPVYFDSVSIVPDSVALTGPESVLRNILQWSTEPISPHADSATTGIVPLTESDYPEIQLSAVACRYYLSQGVAKKGMLTGFAHCDQTGEQIPFTMTFYTRSDLALKITDFGITCRHGNDHLLKWSHTLPYNVFIDILHLELEYDTSGTQKSENR